MYIGLHVKYQLLLSNFLLYFNFLDKIYRNTQTPNFMEIRPVGAELFQADGETDRA